MTAMPAWGVTHSDAEIWNIVAFLQKLPRLSPQQYRALTQGSPQHHRMGG
jgi:mono/diheme cytochrome c family protein